MLGSCTFKSILLLAFSLMTTPFVWCLELSDRLKRWSVSVSNPVELAEVGTTFVELVSFLGGIFDSMIDYWSGVPLQIGV